MNLITKFKVWLELRRLRKRVRMANPENYDGIMVGAKQSALNHPDRAYGDRLMRKLIEYDFDRQARARDVGFGYKRGSNW